MQNRWRLINTGFLDGPANMAVDEALLNRFDPEASLPVLRLYGWNPPALSVGRFQKAEEVLKLNEARQRGVAAVRRITGGGVIYHADELTYSLVCRSDTFGRAAVKDAFRQLTSFLRTFYRGLGLAADFAEDTVAADCRLGERTAYCFAGKESCDIVIDGRKIGGNAQRRLREVIFQHGSIPLFNRSAVGAGFMCEPPPEIAGQTTALRELAIAAPVEELQERLVAAFAETMQIQFEEGPLTEDEAREAERLKEGKLEWK